MKLALLFIVGISSLQNVFSQASDLQIVASAGSSLETNEIILDWTLGELMVQTLDRPSGMISQGFHQPLYTIVDVKYLPRELGNIIVSPNPFSTDFTINMSFVKPETGTIMLYDLSGKELWRKDFEGNTIMEQYNASALSSGSYMLVVSGADDSFTSTHQILKNQ